MSKRKIKDISLIPRRVILKEKLFTTTLKVFVVASLLFMATYTWLIHNKEFNINHLSVGTSPINQLLISLDNGVTWHDKAELDISENFTLHKEITGDGIDMYKPTSKESNGMPTSFTLATKGNDYLEYKVLFKSQMNTTIYLEKKSTIYPAAGTNPIHLLNSSEVVRESPNGNFSKDLIAGATRVAFIENDYIDGEFIEQNTPKYIWAPNKGYQIRFENNKYVAYLNSSQQQSYKYTKVIDHNNFYEVNLPNIVEDINAFLGSPTTNDIPLTIIENSSEIEEENIKAVTIRIWIEGNDRETTYALKGGLFKIYLSFIGLKNNP